MARWLGFEATILVPADMAQERIEAIRSEGAEVRVVDGSYDDAVDASAELAGERCLVISDTAWPGYEDGAALGDRGLLDDPLGDRRRTGDAQGEPGPDLVVVQIGVGALAAAVVRHYRRPELDPQPVIVGVEPTRAACALASIEAGEIVQIPGPHDSIMSGLNCGVPSPLAWPLVSAASTVRGRRRRPRPAGDARPGAARELPPASAARRGWPDSACSGSRGTSRPGSKRALIISSEGVTDRAAYEQIVRHRN